ncbi:hypothetical protein DFH11DRAFT_1548428 [Phellopilus nigrolimitatus]|nr:hypothetical protein DFH11DRAFT_1548428 [Phellopilus nigrolimitatus]
MLAVITVYLSLLAAIKICPVTAQTFSLVCNGDSSYPDVCDTFSFANLCHGITATLHYDATSDANTGQQRRTAVGCTGSANQCAGTDDQCDEYPYASTYDGGLGCYPDGYQGQDQLAQSGATRCANSVQNQRHGQAIGQFYSNVLHNNNGQSFLVGYQNDVRGPLGEAISVGGTQACPSGSGTDIYRYRSTPANDGSSSNSTNTLPFQILFHNVTAESGRVVTVPYRQEQADVVEKWLAVGQPIWTHDDDGNGVAEKIVTSNLMFESVRLWSTWQEKKKRMQKKEYLLENELQTVAVAESKVTGYELIRRLASANIGGKKSYFANQNCISNSTLEKVPGHNQKHRRGQSLSWISEREDTAGVPHVILNFVVDVLIRDRNSLALEVELYWFGQKTDFGISNMRPSGP